jgi:hypothetical protein
MPTPTYEKIEAKTLGSATATVSFTSIPATYTDLVLVMNGSITSVLANAVMQFNTDTGSNYSYTFLTGDGSSATSGRAASQTQILLNYYGYFDTVYGTNMIVQIQNYANSTTNKTLLSRANNSANGTAAVVGLWRSTAAINSMQIKTGSSTFTAGCTFTLYGIKAA